jgi:hypothetical protein
MTETTEILLDSPDDGICESHGWVTTDTSVEEARNALREFCLDEDDEPGYLPQGDPTRVWLAPDGGSPEAEYWVKAESTATGAREFYEFDVTA